MKFSKSNLLCFVVFYCCYLCQAIAVNGSLPEGTLKLIIKTYIEDLIASADVIDEIIKTKLLSLSDHIFSHPALHQTHFHVGSEPPNYEPLSSTHVSNSLSNTLSTNGVEKKSGNNNVLVKRQNPNISVEQLNNPNSFPPDEICSTNRSWEQIDTAHDYYENPVNIVQEPGHKQYIYTYRCANIKPCVGISPIFKSECTERYGLVTLYFENKNKKRMWGPVLVPHHCACKIQRLFFGPSEETTKKKR